MEDTTVVCRGARHRSGSLQTVPACPSDKCMEWNVERWEVECLSMQQRQEVEHLGSILNFYWEGCIIITF